MPTKFKTGTKKATLLKRECCVVTGRYEGMLSSTIQILRAIRKCYPFNSRSGWLKGPNYIQYSISTPVGQAVACAPVKQRARVRSPVGTGFVGEETLGPQGPRISFGRHNHPFIFALLE